MARWRVLQVGVGGAGRRRLELLSALPEVEVVAAVDPSAQGRADARARGVDDAREDFDAALAQARPDAVVVSTPHGLHTAQVAASLASGAHVLCEKPMGVSAAGVRALRDSAAAAGLHLAMARNHLHLPSVAHGLALVTSNGIGAVRDMCVEIGHGRGAQLTAWHHSAALAGGGCLRDNGAHGLLLTHALWRALGDRPERARTLQYVPLEDGGVDAEVEAEVISAAGRKLGLKASWRLAQGYRFAVRVTGAEGALEIDGPVGLRWRRGDAPWQAVTLADAGPMESWRRDTVDFFDLLGSGAGPAADSLDAALWSAEVTDALYRSARTGQSEAVG